MTLILQDLNSGYIFLEKSSSKRNFSTWCKESSEALSGFTYKVLYTVSDRAKPLIKLANEYLKCPSVADLFHILNDINKEFALSISWRVEDTKKKLAESEKTLKQSSKREHSICQKEVEQQKVKLDQIESAHCSWLQTLKNCSLCVHPFDAIESKIGVEYELEPLTPIHS